MAVLTSSYANSTNELKDLNKYEITPAHYFSGADCPYTFESVAIEKASSYSHVRSLVHSKKFDVYFNLCDGMKDEDRAGDDVAQALEEFNVPYTGVDMEQPQTTKPDMKMIAHYNNIKTPKFFVVEEIPSAEELAQLASGLKYPLIVKHPDGHNSIGITRASKCWTLEELARAVTTLIDKYKCAMVEEFIVGDEVTVLAVATPNGTKVLLPMRVIFQPGEDFKHFDLKWKDFKTMDSEPVSDDDPALAEILRVGKVAFEAISGGVGYGRSDLRVDRTTNDVYFLELNFNPAVLYPPGSECSADWILRLDPTFNHRDFITALIDTAFLTHKKRQPLYKVTFNPVKGYHVVAACPLAKGSVVFADEGKPFRIVTRPYVEANWSEADKQVFSRYAWPLSSDAHVYVTWEKYHNKWRPLNHSCEPNLVFAAPHSLNCVAARDIQRSEELTMDYATFCDMTMKEFDCHCGAPSCRGRISVTEEVIRKYGVHGWHRSIPKVQV